MCCQLANFILSAIFGVKLDFSDILMKRIFGLVFHWVGLQGFKINFVSNSLEDI